ncbi:MAG: hypothetical protein RIS36_1241 [Pseudomonadota bacterium]|jgi:hypothetical protein
MQKTTALLMILTVATGCDNGPVGRYQMVIDSSSGGASSTYLLDTKNGVAWRLREHGFWPIPVVSAEDAQKTIASLETQLKELQARRKQLEAQKGIAQ